MSDVGRPTTCTQSTANDILKGIAKGDSLSKVCEDLNLIYNTVYSWIRIHKDSFFKDSARAYEAGYDKIADDCIEIADDWHKDVSVDDKGRETVDHEVIQRSRLRIDTRLRLLGKWAPKRYGDKIDVNHGAQPSFSALLDELYQDRLDQDTPELVLIEQVKDK